MRGRIDPTISVAQHAKNPGAAPIDFAQTDIKDVASFHFLTRNPPAQVDVNKVDTTLPQKTPDDRKNIFLQRAPLLLHIYECRRDE